MTTPRNKKIVALALIACASARLTAAPDFTVTLHGNATAGVTDGSHQRTGIHAHDPNKDYNLQGLEVGVNMRANKHLEGFVNINSFLDGEDELGSEWEEAFLKFKDLPLLSGMGTFDIRAGLYLNRLGVENNVHLHAWDFINANLSTGMFLGEEGLRTQGGEISWLKQFGSGDFMLSGSYGKALEHDHGHGEEEHDEDEDGHDDEEEHGHDEENESQELAYFNDDLFTARAQLRFNSTDFFQHKAGLNFAQGDNGFGRDTSLFGVDYTFTWRENGFETGGREISAGVEYFNRNVEWQDEIDASKIGDTSQQSLALKTSYAWNKNWRLSARYEWVEGVSGEVFDIEDYKRASLALTHTKRFTEDWSTVTRLQFNHDDVGSDKSNNLYLQIGFSYGGNEVR